MDERTSGCRPSYWYEIWQVVGVNASRVYIRVDFIGKCFQWPVMLVDSEVYKVSMAVGGFVPLSLVDVGAHLTQL